MKQYLELVDQVLREGSRRSDRTGTGTLSLFGTQTRYDLREGFPLLTTKKVLFSAVVRELLWFLRGSTNINDGLTQHTPIWDAWIRTEPNVGPLSDKRPLVWIDPRQAVGEETWDGGGPGCLEASGSSEDVRLRGQWRHMMGRCYLPEHHRYANYGAVGVRVCRRWHDPENFCADVKTLPNWECKLSAWTEYELDKDYYGSSVYSPETCVWLHQSENKCYMRNVEPIRVTPPSGDARVYLSEAQAAADMDLPTSTVCRWVERAVVLRAKGQNKRFNGWRFEKLTRSGKLLRRAFSFGELGPIYGAQWRSWGGRGIDQLEAARRLLRDHPCSRRNLVSAWNVADLPAMKLPPCHVLFQLYVTDGRLDLQLYQRSADLALGVPFNIASYALLLTMLAQEAALEPGVLIHTIGDAHVYLNHVDGLRTQLGRAPLPLPKVSVTSKPIDELVFEDIALQGYQHHPFIRFEVSV